jgi:two-component system copper resistance phosphate regulon response regulator CusR
MRSHLTKRGFAVDVAETLADGLDMASSGSHDVILLDLSLPDGDGKDFIDRLRRERSATPIIVLSARGEIAERLGSLDLGADDYLVKPFDFGELLARLRALIRRGRLPLLPERVVVGSLTLDTRSRRVRIGAHEVSLTAREYALLEYLARRAGDVVSRADIAEHVWDDRYDPMSNVVDVYVQRLRRKLDLQESESLIRTRRGEGYQLVADGNDAR